MGCAARSAKGRSALHGREFLLQSAEGVELFAGVPVRVSFSNDVVSFHGGCNGASGEYTLQDGRLVLSSFASSLMGCEAIEHERDRWLSAFFSAQPRVELDGQRLRLSDGTVRLEFLDRVEADPDRPLQATQWVVSIYVDGESGMGLLGITSPHLVFLQDGRFTLRASCREGNGSYEIVAPQATRRGVQVAGRIRFLETSFSEGPCAQDNDRTAAEFVSSVLEPGELEYRIEGPRLMLSGQPRGLVLHAAE